MLLDIKDNCQYIYFKIMNDAQKQLITALGEYNLAATLFRNATSHMLGLNTTDMECLSLLGVKGIATPTELAHYTGLTTGSTTAMLDRLEKAKLITRKPNPNDRRGTLIEVSKNLQKTLRPTYADIQKVQNKLISSYSDAELAIIAGFLAQFAENVKTHAMKLDART